MTPSRDKPRLLLVDDSRMLLRSFQRLLGDDYDITAAHDGLDALAQYDRVGPFPVVVTDHRMGRMHGADLIRSLSEQDPTCVGLVLSGYVGDLPLLRLKSDRRVFRLLRKPCTVEDLTAALDAAYDEHHRRVAESAAIG